MIFVSPGLNALKLEIGGAFDDLLTPTEPKRVYACTTANLPPAANWPYCVVFDTTANVLKTSNGASWV